MTSTANPRTNVSNRWMLLMRFLRLSARGRRAALGQNLLDQEVADFSREGPCSFVPCIANHQDRGMPRRNDDDLGNIVAVASAVRQARGIGARHAPSQPDVLSRRGAGQGDS